MLENESPEHLLSAGNCPEQAGRKVSLGNIKDTHQGLTAKLGVHSPHLSLCSLNSWVCPHTILCQLLMEK